MKRKLSIGQKRRRALMFQAVDDQLSSPDTPEVRFHYQRLLDDGFTDEDAHELVATILSFYLWHTARGDDYDYADYVEELAKLPEIEWHDDDDSAEEDG